MEEAWNSIVRWGPLWSKLSSKHVKTLTIPTCCISRPQLTPTNATNASTHRPTPCIGKHSKLQRLQHFESFQRPPATIIPFLGLPNWSGERAKKNFLSSARIEHLSTWVCFQIVQRYTKHFAKATKCWNSGTRCNASMHSHAAGFRRDAQGRFNWEPGSSYVKLRYLR